MNDDSKGKARNVADDKASSKETEELIHFIKQTMTDNMTHDEEVFFRDLAHEMTGAVKELALLIIGFRKDLRSKIHPDLTDIATRYIPQTTDQLEAIIKATEMAANKIMDNLESMREDIEKMEKVLASLKQGTIAVPGAKKEIDGQTIENISPLIDYIESNIKDYMSLISDSFVPAEFSGLDRPENQAYHNPRKRNGGKN